MTEIEKKLTDHNHDKYMKTPEFNTLAADVFNARLAQANLITKTDFDAKLSRKLTVNKSKHLHVESELKKLKTFDWSYFRGKSHFEEDGTQNSLVYQPMYRYFKTIAGVGNGSYIYYWQSKGLSDKRIYSIKTLNNSITPNLNSYGTKTRVEFKGRCLKQDKIMYTHGKIISVYIVYEIVSGYSGIIYLTLQNAVFGAVKLTKNADIDKYRYSFLGGGFGKNVIIFGVDMSSSTKTDRKKDILILVKGLTQGSEHTLTTEKMYSINSSDWYLKFCLNLHYNGANSYLFVNWKKNS